MFRVPTPDVIAFRSVRAIDPSCQLDALVDVLIEHGRIVRLGPGACNDFVNTDRVRVIDGRGRWLLPALVEMHAHLREPGYEYKEDIESGLKAAAAGGYAHVCAMPNTKPVNDTRAITEMMVARAKAIGGPSLHPVSAITVGLLGKELVEMADQKDAGAVAVSDDGRCVMSTSIMRRALEYASTFGMTVIQHAEDHELTSKAQMNEGANSTRLGLAGWPRAAEDIIVSRDVILVEATGAPYHVAHVSSRGAVRIIRDAKARGLPVTAEVAPHHLLLDDSLLSEYDPVYKVNPPLRERQDIDEVLAALADGTIDCIATDHAPHSLIEKDCDFVDASHGMIGLQTCLPLMLALVQQKRLALTRMIDALTQRPAKILGINAPVLRENQVAEVCLVDPEANYVLEPSMIFSKSKNTPFLGKELVGRVDLTMADGRICFDRS